MLNPNELVGIYIGDLRPLPTCVMLLVLEFSGLVTRGHRSMHFWVFCERPLSGPRARRPGDRSRRRLR